MSFSSDVRNELGNLDTQSGNARHCLLAELSAFIHAAGRLHDGTLSLATEHAVAARKFARLLQTVFRVDSPVLTQKRMYAVAVDSMHTERVLRATGTAVPAVINPLVVADQCCKRAFIRGVFIVCGTLSDPNKTYHLEFSLPPPHGAVFGQNLSATLQSFGLHAKTLERKHHTVVYVKESENIVDLLNIMEAHRSLMQLENIRILKEMRNSVNRKVNFETANLTKTVNAAVQQIEDIRYIAEHVGLGYLSGPLEEVARLRLANDAASLKEIGGQLSPPVGKSGVNHRLRKISAIADQLRNTAEAEGITRNIE